MKKWNGRKWVIKTIWLGFYIAVGMTLYYAIRFKAELPVRNVKVEIIAQDDSRALIAEDDVLRYVKRLLGKDLAIHKIEELDVKRIEDGLNQSKYIEKAEIDIAQIV